MSINRRAFVGAAALSLAAAPVTAQQTLPAGATARSLPTSAELMNRLLEEARRNRRRLSMGPDGPSGPGLDFLVSEGQAAQFFLIGEQHGVAEVPRLAKFLFTALRPSGYEKLVVEVSPEDARDLDQAARTGMAGIEALYRQSMLGPAFFGQHEEAELLASVVSGAASREQVVWGLDYEVGGFVTHAARLLELRPPAAARSAVQALVDAAQNSMRQFMETRNPQTIPNFSMDPALVRAAAAAWADPPARAASLQRVLEETLEINRLFFTGRNQASNARRNRLNRSNLHDYWRAELKAGRAPRAMFKFGGDHVIAGLNSFNAFDVGNAAFELAALQGRPSFSILAGGGPGPRPHAQLNPMTFRYETATNDFFAYEQVPLAEAAFEEEATVIDLRPLRPLVGQAQQADINPALARVIHGIDALVVFATTTPSKGL